jgi:hypothetical protein
MARIVNLVPGEDVGLTIEIGGVKWTVAMRPLRVGPRCGRHDAPRYECTNCEAVRLWAARQGDPRR